MKRTVVGFSLLIVLLSAGILSGRNQTRHHEQVAGLLEQAARYAAEDNLRAAAETAADARSVWRQGWTLAAVFTDHSPLEQIDVGFSRLEIYRKAGDTLSFGAVCAELAGQVRALGDAHGVQWWNIL